MLRQISLIAALILTFGAVRADVARPETILDTLTLMRDAARAAGFPDAVIDLAHNSIKLDPANPDGMIANPDSLHRSLQQAADDAARQQTLDNFVGVLTKARSEQLDSVPPDRVFAVVRHKSYLETLPDQKDLFQTPFVGDLIVLYVVDYPSHTASLGRAEAAASNLAEADLPSLAAANFKNLAAGMSVQGTGPYILSLDGYYESTALLDSEFWTGITTQIGPLVMVAPARDAVFFGPDTPELQDMLAEARDTILNSAPYPLSELLYRWTDTGWQVIPDP